MRASGARVPPLRCLSGGGNARSSGDAPQPLAGPGRTVSDRSIGRGWHVLGMTSESRIRCSSSIRATESWCSDEFIPASNCGQETDQPMHRGFSCRFGRNHATRLAYRHGTLLREDKVDDWPIAHVAVRSRSRLGRNPTSGPVDGEALPGDSLAAETSVPSTGHSQCRSIDSRTSAAVRATVIIGSGRPGPSQPNDPTGS